MILVCMCVRMYVSFMSIGCMYHEYDRRTGDVDIKRRRRRFFFLSRIWTRSGLIRGDPKFGQGLGYVAALQVNCLRVYGVSVTFMSTGYMCHEYTGD